MKSAASRFRSSSFWWVRDERRARERAFERRRDFLLFLCRLPCIEMFLTVKKLAGDRRNRRVEEWLNTRERQLSAGQASVGSLSDCFLADSLNENRSAESTGR